jgi:hypothetical protein
MNIGYKNSSLQVIRVKIEKGIIQMKTIFKNLPITPPLTWMIVFMVATLSACANQPEQANISTLSTSLGKHQLEFVDLGSFDRELSLPSMWLLLAQRKRQLFLSDCKCGCTP